MSSGLDMSLDDLIKQSKSRPKASPASSSGPTRRTPPATRAAPYPPAAPKAAAAPPYGVYSEHVAAMATSALSPPAAAPRALETGTKLHISNLDASVTVEDVQELFSEVGELKHYSVNYDKDGRSKGTAEVVFTRKVDALDAVKRYSGVLLDGKPIKIELIGNNAEPPPTTRLIYDRAFPNYNAIPNSLICKLASIPLSASFFRSGCETSLIMYLKGVALDDHFTVMVVPEAVARAMVAGDTGKPEGMFGIVCRNLLQILMLNWTSIMLKQ